MKFHLFSLIFLLFSCQKTDKNTLASKKAFEMLLNKQQREALEIINDSCQKQDKMSCELTTEQTLNSPNEISISMSIPVNGEVVFSAVSDLNNDLQLIVKINEKFYYPENIERIKNVNNDYQLNLIHFKLLPNLDYTLYVFDNKNTLKDKRNFSTNNPLEQKQVKFSIASCMYDEYQEQDFIWKLLEKDSPDVALMIGDNVYIDTGIYRKMSVSPYHIWKRWFETRKKLTFYYFKKLIPQMSMWDDHDYGVNNGGIDFPHKDIAKKALFGFLPRPSKGIIQGPGASYLYPAKHFDLLFLDNRSFRQKNKNGDHLGADQLSFLKMYINKNQTPLFIVKGDQFFGGYHEYESYENDHPKEFKEFLEILSSTERRIVFITGDRHLSEVMQKGRYLEITSSPIHSKVFPDSFKSEKNPLRIHGIGDQFNYIIMNYKSDDKKIEYFLRDLDNIVRFKDVYSL